MDWLLLLDLGLNRSSSKGVLSAIVKVNRRAGENSIITAVLT